jgi:hypothetical protein
MPIYINSCQECDRYLLAGRCIAFPNGIPSKIWENDDDHSNPYEGDNGIQFEPIEPDNA